MQRQRAAGQSDTDRLVVVSKQQKALVEQNKAARKKSVEQRASHVVEAAGLLAPRAVLDGNAENKEPAGGAQDEISGALGSHPPSVDSDEESETESEARAREEKLFAATVYARVTADVNAHFQTMLDTMAAKMTALEAQVAKTSADNARLEKEARDAAERVALEAEEDEDTGEETGIKESAPVATKGQAKPVLFTFPQAASAQMQTVMHIPLPARPPILVYSALEKTLETWCKQMRNWFRATQLTEEANPGQPLIQAVYLMDAQLQEWWDMQEVSKSARLFEELEKSLLATFIRKDAVERALSALRDVRMNQGEDTHQYFLRVEELRVKARVADDDRMVLATVFDRFDQSRWPIAFANASEELRAGRIKTISALRDFLSTKVMCEPKLNLHRSQQSAPAKTEKKRVSALESGESNSADGIAEHMANMARMIAALTTERAGSRENCLRCKKPGHWVGDCKEPDRRECFKCHKPGHVRRNCPEDGQEKAASATPAPKNE